MTGLETRHPLTVLYAMLTGLETRQQATGPGSGLAKASREALARLAAVGPPGLYKEATRPLCGKGPYTALTGL